MFKLKALLLEGPTHLFHQVANNTDDVFVGFNEAYHSWEDFSIRKYAILLYDRKKRQFRLVIWDKVKNLEPPAYENEKIEADKYVGTLEKPDLKGITSLLVKYNITKSRASSPFKRSWTTPMGKEIPLSKIVALTKSYLQQQYQLNKKGDEYNL